MPIKKSAIILAGGKGSRLGYVDKAFLKYKEKYFIDILIEKLQIFDEIIVVSNFPEKYTNYKNIKVVKDKIKDIGPLGGIYSGLMASDNTEALVISCDTPFINEEFLKYLKKIHGDYSIAVPVTKTNREPLCALYKKNILKKIEESIEKKYYKINSIFEPKYMKWIDIEEFINKDEIIKGFHNVNTEKELEEMWNFSM